METDSVKCVCGTALSEKPGLSLAQRTPCPDCGSLKRTFSKTIEAEVTMKASLAGDQKRPGFKSGKRKRPVVEFFEGWDPSHAFGWVKKRWRTDRATGRYEERVELEDGTVIRDVDESLRDHTGHGSDKTS